MGKVLSGILRHSGRKPVVSFCGMCEITEDSLEEHGVQAVEIGKGIPKEESVRNAAMYLEQAADHYFGKE